MKTPILLVEGEDDERIWQQAVRTSEGRIKIYPCSVGTVNRMNEFERETKEILQAVYERAKGYSLRDRDNGEEDIDDMLPITRMKLSCRNAENLLLTDEVLQSLGIDWAQLKHRINDWIEKNEEHEHHEIIKKFKEEGYDRKNFNLKKIRNDLMGIIGSEKPWEIAVGRVLANLKYYDDIDFEKDGTILSYLGRKTTQALFPR